MSKTKQPAGTPTALNIKVLGRLSGGEREFSNALSAVDATHIRRCLNAGLVEVINPTTLRLTDAGVVAIAVIG